MLVNTKWSRYAVAVASFLILGALLTSRNNGYAVPGLPLSVSAKQRCTADLNFIGELRAKYNISDEFEYASRQISYKTSATQRESITEIDKDLIPGEFQLVNTTHPKLLPQCFNHIQLPVTSSPRPDAVDASSMLFGVSTVYSRFMDADLNVVEDWAQWLTDGNGTSNGAGLILTLYNATADELENADAKLKAFGIEATVMVQDAKQMADRYFNLVSILYNHPSRPRRSYLTIIDDDTFFPSMHQLVKTLRRYNPLKPYYFGAMTERTDWVEDRDRAMAYGGASVTFTPPLAESLTQLTPQCLDEFKDWDEGDTKLYQCVHTHTDVVLTYLRDLHQLDTYGDPSGFYESGQQPLSIHHYKSWHHILPTDTFAVAHACGLDCIFQRFQFADNYILSNGFSVTSYPAGIDFDPETIEDTFGEHRGLTYTLGPLRKSLSKTGEKKGWGLIGAKREGSGVVRQVYWKRKDDERWVGPGEEAPKLDSLVELIWLPNSYFA